MEAKGGMIDIGRVFDNSAWNPYQKLLIVLTSLAFLMDGIANHALGLAIPALMEGWGLSEDAFAPVFAIGLVGLTIGAGLGGMLADHFGSRRVLIGSIGIFGTMTLAAAVADSVATLFWLRFVDGLGIGAAIPTGTALIAEFTPARRRSMAIGFGMVFIGVGAVVSSLIASAILPSAGWRALFVVLGAPALLLMLIFAFALPETPQYLARWPGRKAELLRVIRRCGLSVDSGATIVQDDEKAGRPPIHILLDPSLRGSTLPLWGTAFCVMLSSYIVFSWLPAVLAKLDFALAMTSLGMSAFGSGSIIGSLLVGWLVERLGSQAAMLGLSAGGALSAGALVVLILFRVDSISAMFTALTLLGAFIGALLNGIYILAALLYPPFARGTGLGATSAVGRLGAITSAFAGAFALGLGSINFFLSIAASLILSLIGFTLIRHHVPPSERKQRRRDMPSPA